MPDERDKLRPGRRPDIGRDRDRAKTPIHGVPTAVAVAGEWDDTYTPVVDLLEFIDSGCSDMEMRALLRDMVVRVWRHVANSENRARIARGDDVDIRELQRQINELVYELGSSRATADANARALKERVDRIEAAPIEREEKAKTRKWSLYASLAGAAITIVISAIAVIRYLERLGTHVDVLREEVRELRAARRNRYEPVLPWAPAPKESQP